jgi:GT2 family glycosyltransferase
MTDCRRPAGAGPSPDVTVIIATRNRAADLCRSLRQQTALPERPRLIVVDNGSADGTPAIVTDRFPATEVISLPGNRGAAARNAGAARAATRYVAFSDDDSWWEPGALGQAVQLLDRHPDVGLVAARVLVGPEATADPINAVLAASPLPAGHLPGPRVLGFLGCAAVARRSAFLDSGGFSELLFLGGEEELLAMDLAAAGHAISYASGVTARHWPSAVRDAPQRRWLLARNQVLVAWLRRPVPVAAAATAELARRARKDPEARRALAEAARALPGALRQRRRLPAPVEAQVRLLEQHGRSRAGSAAQRGQQAAQ